MVERFHGKRVIVTGAGSGIGRAITERILREGGQVLAVDKLPEGIATLAKSERLRTHHQDVTEHNAPATIVALCLKYFGGIDVLVNNAGVGKAPRLHETTDEDFDRFIDINLRGTFRLTREALPHLIESKGNIVNIASLMAINGMATQAPYAAAKGGVVAFTRQVAAEYGPVGVRSNAIAPGMIHTPGTAARYATGEYQVRTKMVAPLSRFGSAEELAAAAVFLASDDASYVTGQVLAVDGGASSSVFISDEVANLWAAHYDASQKGMQTSDAA